MDLPRRFCMRCQTPLRGVDWDCGACGASPSAVNGIVCLSPTVSASHDGFDESLFAEYDALSKRHFWFIGRRKLMLDTIQNHFGALGRFLEVGCGNGDVLEGMGQAFPLAELWAATVHWRGCATRRGECRRRGCSAAPMAMEHHGRDRPPQAALYAG